MPGHPFTLTYIAIVVVGRRWVIDCRIPMVCDGVRLVVNRRGGGVHGVRFEERAVSSAQSMWRVKRTTTVSCFNPVGWSEAIIWVAHAFSVIRRMLPRHRGQVGLQRLKVVPQGCLRASGSNLPDWWLSHLMQGEGRRHGHPGWFENHGGLGPVGEAFYQRIPHFIGWTFLRTRSCLLVSIESAW